MCCRHWDDGTSLSVCQSNSLSHRMSRSSLLQLWPWHSSCHGYKSHVRTAFMPWLHNDSWVNSLLCHGWWSVLAECQLLYNMSQLFCGVFSSLYPTVSSPSIITPVSDAWMLSGLQVGFTWVACNKLSRLIQTVIGVDASAEVNNYNVSYLLIKTVT